MNTYFAPAERVSENRLFWEIETVNKSPVISGLLHSISGLLAILDEHRQIIAINDSFLEMLYGKDPANILGLRPGEAIECVHAHDQPAGCGTTKFCSSCGAAIAIVSCLRSNRTAEEICALTINREGQSVDIALRVRSHPIKVEGSKFLLLFLQDITAQQQRAALERTFFHDVNNILSALLGASEMLSQEDSQSNLVRIIYQSALRLKKEVEMQRCLSQSESCTYSPIRQEITTRRIHEEFESFFTNHPETRSKRIEFLPSDETLSIDTDLALLLRVLCNMVTNALEATEENGVVKVWFEQKDHRLSYFVWNRNSIDKSISNRVFQRNFSTKEGAGRGVGTYSMKLFGEKILGGRVTFTTSQAEGTVFKFSLPC